MNLYIHLKIDLFFEYFKCIIYKYKHKIYNYKYKYKQKKQTH